MPTQTGAPHAFRLVRNACRVATITVAATFAVAASASAATVVPNAVTDDAGAGSAANCALSPAANPGTCSLRDAVALASQTSGTIVSLQSPAPAGPYPLNHGLVLSGSAQITIQGSGAAGTVIDESASSVVDSGIDVPGGATLTVNNLTISGNNSIDPALEADQNATLLLSGVAMSGNTTIANLDECLDPRATLGDPPPVEEPVTEPGDALEVEGGALYNGGHTTIVDSSFTNNLADGSKAANEITAPRCDTRAAPVKASAARVASSERVGTAAKTAKRARAGGTQSRGAVRRVVRAASVVGIPIEEGGAYGGAIFNDGGGVLTIVNSTLSGNTAKGAPGGVAAGGSLFSAGTLTLNSSTVAGGQTTVPPAVTNARLARVVAARARAASVLSINQGGNLVLATNIGGSTIANSIVARGVSSAGSENCEVTSVGLPGDPRAPVPVVIASGGHNVEALDPVSGSTQCMFTAAGDQLLSATSLRLAAAPAANGSAPNTLALLSGSPAIDAVPLAACTDPTNDNAALSTDERGFSRPVPVGGACDAGAYESSPPAVTLNAASAIGQTSATLGGSVDPRHTATTYAFTYTPQGGSAAATQAQTIAAGSSGAQNVTAALSGLIAGTTYSYTLTAINQDGTATTTAGTFTTTALPATPSATPPVVALPLTLTHLAPISKNCVRPFVSAPTPGAAPLAFKFTLNRAATVTFTIMRHDGSPTRSQCPKGKVGGTAPESFSTMTPAVTFPGQPGTNQESLGNATAASHRAAAGGHLALQDAVSAALPAGRGMVHLAALTGSTPLAPGTYVLMAHAVASDGAQSTDAFSKFYVVVSS